MSRLTRRATSAVLTASAVACLLAVGVGTALAARGDPQERFTPADQARARAMLVRKSDLPAGFKATSSSADEPRFYCKALDESDLTLTGEAESPDYENLSKLAVVSSVADVYESTADAAASWRRGTSAAGERCVRDLVRRVYARHGVRLVSMGRLAFPRVAPRTAAYRAQLAMTAQGVTVPFVLDLVILMHSRAQAALSFGSGIVPTARAEELRLARLTAKRMATAMRGS